MPIQRFCEQCGWALPATVRGRPAKICGECLRGRRRVKERSAVCQDCGVTFVPPGQTGDKPKRCSACSEIYYRNRNSRRQKEWRKANPEREKASQNKSNRKRLADPAFLQRKREDAMRRAYGISPEQFATLLESQGGKCALCFGPPNGPGDRLHVDHCHNTKRIRGLLCAKCNTLLGLAGDDPKLLARAIKYLKQ